MGGPLHKARKSTEIPDIEAAPKIKTQNFSSYEDQYAFKTRIKEVSAIYSCTTFAQMAVKTCADLSAVICCSIDELNQDK